MFTELKLRWLLRPKNLEKIDNLKECYKPFSISMKNNIIFFENDKLYKISRFGYNSYFI